MKQLSKFLRVLDRLSVIANMTGSMLILALMLLIATDVITKNTLLWPIPGVPELMTLSIVAIVFLQAPQALRAGRFTRSDGVITILHQHASRLASCLETLFDMIGAFVLCTILYAHWPILIKAWERNEFIGSLSNFTAPTWPVKAILALGAFLLAMQFIARIIRRHWKTDVSI